MAVGNTELTFISEISARSRAFICNGVCNSDRRSLEYTSGASMPNCSSRVTNQSDMALTARADTSWGYFMPKQLMEKKTFFSCLDPKSKNN